MTEERVNRKLAAILAADVVGYSRLMGADEAGTLAALKRHRETIFDPAVAAHNGRIVKLIGDGTIVEFGSVVDVNKLIAKFPVRLLGVIVTAPFLPFVVISALFKTVMFLW